MPISVPKGHVALILLQDENWVHFYLQIPLDVIHNLCLNPRKYLLFLGWCILGVEGVLDLQPDGIGIDIDGGLDDQGIYHYVPNEMLDLAHAIDLEVIKTSATQKVFSETMETRDGEFRRRLLERDVCCVWTGVDSFLCVGLRIIPYNRGSKWLQLIVANRPKYAENVRTLNNINDIRNGLFASLNIHRLFDQRRIAILKTPNRILETEDVPPCHARKHGISEDVSYPTDSRYSVQRLVTPNTNTMALVPNNSDATFKKRTRKQKPSDLLLHYTYGAAAVQNWGHSADVLQRLANPPRPVPAPTGPSSTIQNRVATTACKNSGAGTGTGQEMDADDMVLFFWGNTRAAKERHHKKINKNSRRIEAWRGSV
ncbi:hypothetical protein F5887DRAFT_229408 [Amanita rubescens]|nr:hypothetical protein F5887DRAFT_229408 [Amanita rubescens]